MAGTEEEVYICEESVSTRISTLPLVKSTKECYKEYKTGSSLFNIGSSVLEFGLGAVSWTTRPLQFGLSSVFKSQANKFEGVAHHCLDAIEDNYPVAQQPLKKITKRIKRRMMGYVNSGAQTIMNSSWGQGAINGLDTLVTVSEAVLTKVAPYESVITDASSVPKSSLNGTNPTIQSSIPEDLEDKPVPAKKEESFRSPIERLSAQQQSEGITRKILACATYPLRWAVELLKAIQDLLHQMEYGKVWSSRHVSPQKLAEIQKRRKVSPRKRLSKRPLYQRFARGMLSIFPFGRGGKKTSLPVRVRRMLGTEDRETGQRPGSASDDAERKRKHDDIESEDNSDYTDSDEFDWDEYVSDEDPDYEPSNEVIADDSLEYQEGETESDVDLKEEGVSPAKGRTRNQNRKKKLESDQKEKKKGTTPKKGDATKAKPVKAAADSNTSPKGPPSSADFPPLSKVTANGHHK